MTRRITCVLLAIALSSTVAFAAGWSGGGPYGGYVYALSRSPSNHNTVYAGTPDGVYKSTDGGTNWVRRGPGGVAIRALAASSSNLVYAGTNDGVIKTTDGGTSWTDAGLSGVSINALVVHPTNPQVALAGVGDPATSSISDDKGIYRTINGGVGWTKVLSKDINSVNTLIFDEDDPMRVYAGATPKTILNLPFFRSVDGGITWVGKAATGVGTSIWGLSMTRTGTAIPTVYALSDTKISKTINRGDTWSDSNTTNVSGASCAIVVDPTETTRVFLSTDYAAGKFYRTNVDGVWTRSNVGFPPAGSSVMNVDFSNGYILLGVGGMGVYQSRNRGTSWEASNTGLDAGAVSGIAPHPTYAKRAFAALADGYIYETWTAGTPWTAQPSALYGGGVLSIDPRNTTVMYLGAGNRLYKSYTLGGTWDDGYVFPSYQAESPVIEAILINANNSNLMLAALRGAGNATTGGGIYKSTTGGATWVKKANWWKVPALAADPVDPAIVYCGTAQGGYVDRSDDGGDTWTPITPGGTWVVAVHDLAVDRQGYVYAATTDGLLKWTGDGINWTKFTGLPANDVRAVIVDTRLEDDIIFAAVQGHGVYVTDDFGVTWKALNTGLGSTKVTKIALSPASPTTLYAATSDRGVWSMESPYQPEDDTPSPGCNGAAATTLPETKGPSGPMGTVVLLLVFVLAVVRRGRKASV